MGTSDHEPGKEEQLTAVVLLVIGFAALLGGGDVLVRGASALARSVGVSALVIGMTVVAFGTSAPELGVNITAALNDRGSISFGNVVGSSMANIGLILGLAALIRPLGVANATLKREFPFMILATAALLPICLDSITVGGQDRIGRIDGVILLVLFAGFLVFAFRKAATTRETTAPVAPETEEGAGAKKLAWPVALGLTLAGLAGVLVGSHWTVEGAVGVARQLGVDDAIIGLTVVAVGTSLPELATSLIAVRAGEEDLALGNVVGSNVFNILLVLGVTATIRPIDLPAMAAADLAALAMISMALWFMSATQNKIVRWEGAVLLVAYVAYMVWRTRL